MADSWLDLLAFIVTSASDLSGLLAPAPKPHAAIGITAPADIAAVPARLEITGTVSDPHVPVWVVVHPLGGRLLGAAPRPGPVRTKLLSAAR